jgi:protein TonB
MSVLTFESLSAAPRRPAAQRSRRAIAQVVAPVEIATQTEDRYANRKLAPQGKKLALIIATVFAVAAHVGIVVYLNRPMSIEPLPRKIPEMVMEFAPPPPPPQVEPPKPIPQVAKAQPAPRPAPANIPVVQNAVTTSEPTADTVQVAQAVPPPAPPAAPPAPEPVTEPKGYAGYLNNPAPSYPPAAQRRGLQGKVILKIHVLASGQPDNVTVAKSSGYDILDDAAVKAVTGWVFDPAKRGQKAIDGWVNVPINFKLS